MRRNQIRTALYLFHVEKKDTVQIAERLRVTEATIANAFDKNREMRREFLKEGWGTHGG